MVIRVSAEQPNMPPYPATPSSQHDHNSSLHGAPSVHTGNGADTLHQRVAGMDLNSPAELPGSIDVEESSDWDASDREEDDAESWTDTADAAPKPTAAHNLDNTPASKPSDAPPAIPPSLRVGPATSDSSIPNPWAGEHTNAGTKSATVDRPLAAPVSPQRTGTNPFRRPSDFQPSQNPAATSVWSQGNPDAMRSHQASPHAETTLPPETASMMSAAYNDDRLGNPFAEEPSASSTNKIPAAEETPLISLDDDNPWGNETHQSSSSSKKPAAATTPTTLPNLSIPPANPSSSSSSSSKPDVETPGTKAQRQRNEVYHVKNIRWHDAKCSKNPRTSPILIQNANGPCPLLALVNALSLTTPPELQTALIETLRTREQVSLGLLLDAVFDELMSGRRGVTGQELPDVGELYSFLITLHTGMNVNPRFVPQTHMSKTADWILGGFEETREMKLYSTFAIPLIHGWTCERNEEAYGAFERTAPTYEDAQHVQFREQEILQKLGATDLTREEQTILSDLTTIKHFLSTWPTQLTEYGLESMKRSLRPGQIAILFRNDHFSTVYKEPGTNQLMTLVTDAGYSSHDEIVWENLVDINGAESEMFAGDFKSVSHTSGNGVQSGRNDGGWTTVETRSKRPPQQGTRQERSEGANGELQAGMALHQRTQSEQEDHDLALALQLQEEEEERQRARRREDELSEHYLSQESSRRGPQIPPRRSNPSVSSPNTNAPTETGEANLPTYEQAAAGQPFHPPRGHPANELAPRAGQQQQPPQQPPRNGRRQSQSTSTSSAAAAGPGRYQPGGRPYMGDRRANPEYASYNSIADRREGCRVM